MTHAAVTHGMVVQQSELMENSKKALGLTRSLSPEDKQMERESGTLPMRLMNGRCEMMGCIIWPQVSHLGW